MFGTEHELTSLIAAGATTARRFYKLDDQLAFVTCERATSTTGNPESEDDTYVCSVTVQLGAAFSSMPTRDEIEASLLHIGSTPLENFGRGRCFFISVVVSSGVCSAAESLFEFRGRTKPGQAAIRSF